MELRQLATFRVVARTLSFTRAAEALDRWTMRSRA